MEIAATWLSGLRVAENRIERTNASPFQRRNGRETRVGTSAIQAAARAVAPTRSLRCAVSRQTQIRYRGATKIAICLKARERPNRMKEVRRQVSNMRSEATRKRIAGKSTCATLTT